MANLANLDPLLSGGLTAIVSVATTTITVYGWLSRRFQRVEMKISKVEEDLEHLEYLTNANRELITHKSQRFETYRAEETQEIEELKSKTQKLLSVALVLADRLQDPAIKSILKRDS